MERINTIGALIKHNHRLGAYCNSVDCHHYKQLDLQALGERQLDEVKAAASSTYGARDFLLDTRERLDRLEHERIRSTP